MQTGRFGHASALLQRQGTTFIVVAGGTQRIASGRGDDYLDSVELMEVTSTTSELKWKAGKLLFLCSFVLEIHVILFSGPRLPKAINGAAMVSLGTKVILLGGYASGEGSQRKIYELSGPMGWQELPQTLQKPRANFVAFAIPTNWTTHC